MSRRSPAGRLRSLLVLGGLAALVGTAAPVATAAGSHSLVQGSGSSWSANAVNQWVADVQTNGLQVVFTSSGSAQGRKDFAYQTTDFGVSDIGYQGTDSQSGDADTSQGRTFAYLPIVAGGTAFPYQLKVGGQQVKNLRLSGTTLAKIFTNTIRSWDDPAITADNNGHALPAIPIIPVTHSEGSGSTAQFTKYLDTEYPSIWRPFFGGTGETEYFPHKDPAIAQNGSDGVMNFIASAAANGAIGFDEYSYAINKGYPVAKVLNAAGNYTAPDQYNVAVALTQASINTDKSSDKYLLQDLTNVYTNPAVQTYPLSSYSYMILPIAANDPKMTTAKRQTLSDFLFYSLCEGQKEMGPIGYSPLPINLVSSGFDQIAKLKQADPNVDISSRDVTTCSNPTFVAGQPQVNHLAQIAPVPPACDMQGMGPCGAISTTKAATTASAPTGASAVTAAGATGSSGTTGAAGTAGTAGAAAAGGSSGAAAGQAGGSTAGAAGTSGSGAVTASGATGSGATTVDPLTGQVVAATDSGSTSADGTVSATAVPLSQYASTGMTKVLGPLAVVLLLLALVAPPVVSHRLAARAARR